MRLLLLLSVAIIATSGLIYELIAGTLASYLLGDSVTQFSTIIGVYLFAMGIGSFLSKYFEKDLLIAFITIEILVGLVGGFSSTALFLLFNFVQSFRFVLYALVGVTGTLVGLEIPLMMRLLRDEWSFSDLVSRVFSFDYAGALVASLAFPLFFVPNLGLIKTAFFFGAMNVLVAILLLFSPLVKGKNVLSTKIVAIVSLVILVMGFIFGNTIMQYTETLLYGSNGEKVIFSTSSPYQRITLTADKQGTHLYLNGNLQFYSADEYRYHEALIHPAFTLFPAARKVLVLGGGDGCAAREALKYASVENLTLVDLDAKMTDFFSKNPLALSINKGSMINKRLKLVNDDAFLWLKNNSNKYDIVIVDFPDPSNYSVGKLYSTAFYRELQRHLTPQSVVAVQSTSPFVAPNAYWCINNTLSATGFNVLPYHDYVPSFGEWGYVLASLRPNFAPDYTHLPADLRFFDSTAFAGMMIFPKDMNFRKTAINQLNNQALVQYFEQEWRKVQ